MNHLTLPYHFFKITQSHPVLQQEVATTLAPSNKTRNILKPLCALCARRRTYLRLSANTKKDEPQKETQQESPLNAAEDRGKVVDTNNNQDTPVATQVQISINIRQPITQVLVKKEQPEEKAKEDQVNTELEELNKGNINPVLGKKKVVILTI